MMTVVALFQRQRRFRSDDGSDAASETSSVCSENSLRSGPDGLSDVRDDLGYFTPVNITLSSYFRHCSHSSTF